MLKFERRKDGAYYYWTNGTRRSDQEWGPFTSHSRLQRSVKTSWGDLYLSDLGDMNGLPVGWCGLPEADDAPPR